MEDDAIGRIDALVSLARSAREDNVDDVLRTVVETVCSAAGFEIVVFNRYQPAWDDYEVVLVIGPTDVQELMHSRRSREEFEEQLVTSEYEIHPGVYLVPGTAEVWNDVTNFVVSSPKRPSVPGEWDPEDALLVQLRDSKGEPLGILSIDEPRSGRMPDLNELRLLRAICSHAEQSLENAQSGAGTERHRNRMTQLLGASTRFAQCQSHREVLETACEALVPGLGFERVAIYFGEGTSSIPLAIATFDEVAIAKTLELPIFELFRDRTSEVAGCWMASAQAVHGTAHGELRSKRNGAGKFAWSNDVLLAPVFDGEGVPRLVFAIEDPINHLRPTEIERELVRLLVEQTDAALERVTFRTRLEHLADHDASTGLLNRRALARIPREASATAALMICDLDHFKYVNDSNGHEVGDAVIARFADLLRSLSREQDFAVRLGGDEFMVLLPGTSVQQAQSVAERLRIEISPLMSTLVASEVTVSIGLTQIESGEQLVDAMRRADSALYAAKKNGRNQIASS
ncbi:MAG TPA: GGDEF domain-containing protein [Acidimicrobiales bacterium]|nr:GGDEF domain-containing protein [Acidimicrobiales bacterium]